MINSDYSREHFTDAPDAVHGHCAETEEQCKKVAMIETTNTVADPHAVMIKLVHTPVVHSCTAYGCAYKYI